MSDALFQVRPEDEARINAVADYYMPPDLKSLLERADNFLADKHKSKMTGVELIAQERLEQKTKHNHTIKSDWEQYPDFELAMIAEAVLTADIGRIPHNFEVPKYQKMVTKPYEERLVIAAALIAAEIDRLKFTEE